MPKRFDISAIANELNLRASGHAVGKLQTMRTRIHGFSRRPGSTIFSRQTTDARWAFHHGGRKELQFNIGTEEPSGFLELRHGLAFSFQLSHSLPSIAPLIPKVRLFNDYLRLYPERYADLRMWHYHNGRSYRSSDYPAGAISGGLVQPGFFVFLGTRQPLDAVNYETVLNDFDRLLPLYCYVESGAKETLLENADSHRFEFRAGVVARASTTSATLAQRELTTI